MAQMIITEAERNLICFLRTRKPYEVVKISFDRFGKPNIYSLNLQQNLMITDEGISEVNIHVKTEN